MARGEKPKKPKKDSMARPTEKRVSILLAGDSEPYYFDSGEPAKPDGRGKGRPYDSGRKCAITLDENVGVYTLTISTGTGEVPRAEGSDSNAQFLKRFDAKTDPRIRVSEVYKNTETPHAGVVLSSVQSSKWTLVDGVETLVIVAKGKADLDSNTKRTERRPFEE